MRIVRHPIYTGLLLAFVGTAIARDDLRGVLAVAMAIFALVRKLRLEEQWMAEQFPGEYPEYRGRRGAGSVSALNRQESAMRADCCWRR